MNVGDPQRLGSDSEILRIFRRGGIVLTDDLLRLGEMFQYRNLGAEVEARWKLVETAGRSASPRLFSA